MHQGAMILGPVWESLGHTPLRGASAGDEGVALQGKRRGRPSRADKLKRDNQENFEFWQKAREAREARAKMQPGGTRGRPGT